jgi:hypothetical protein
MLLNDVQKPPLVLGVEAVTLADVKRAPRFPMPFDPIIAKHEDHRFDSAGIVVHHYIVYVELKATPQALEIRRTANSKKRAATCYIHG